MKLLFSFVFSTLFIHNYHVSNTTIHVNDKSNTLEITMKIFIDDLERLRDSKEESFRQNGDLDSKFEYDSYFLNHFHISINDTLRPISSIGQEIENEMIYCYFEVIDIPEIETIEIENTVLFELFDDQSNMVDVEFSNKNERIVLTKESEKKRLITIE